MDGGEEQESDCHGERRQLEGEELQWEAACCFHVSGDRDVFLNNSAVKMLLL